MRVNTYFILFYFSQPINYFYKNRKAILSIEQYYYVINIVFLLYVIYFKQNL